MKFLNKIQKFMYGRYGADELYKFSFMLYIIFLVIDMFIDFKGLVYLELTILFVIFYRFFSKNIYKRSAENRKFIKLKNKIINPFKKFFKRINDKNNIFKKCSKCKTIVRLPLPYKYGFKYVICPKCKKRLRVLCLKKEKIEVIKTKKVKEERKNV